MKKLLALMLALAVASPTWAYAQAPPAQLKIIILDGEGALNNIKQQTAREPIIEVQDENHRPVAGALVLFTLPQSGPSGTFSGGGTVFNTVTDSAGRATATGFAPNKIAGKFQIQVDVKYQGLTAHTSINQSNYSGANLTPARAVTHAFPVKAVLIVAAVGAAAAVGVALGTRSGSGSGATITAGSGTVTAPSLRRH